MSNQPYEILLRWKDGKFSGGHTVRLNEAGQPDLPKPLGTDAHPWPTALKEINTGLLEENASLKEEIANLQKALDETNRFVKQAKKVVLDDKINDKKTVVALKEMIGEPERKALRRQQLQAELDALK